MLTLESVLEHRDKVDAVHWTDFRMVSFMVIIVIVLLIFLFILNTRSELEYGIGNAFVSLIAVILVGVAIVFMHRLTLYDSEAYKEWRKDFAEPYIMSKEEKYDIIDWEILGAGSGHIFSPDNRTMVRDDYTRVRVLLDMNGEAVAYNFLAKVFVEKGENEKPYVVMNRLEKDLDKKLPAGIYNVAVHIVED